MPMVVEVPRDLETRLLMESKASQRAPDVLLQTALDKYLEDQEDIREAARVLAEVEAGRMRTHPWEEVKARLGLEN